MIFYLVTAREAYTVDNYLKDRGHSWQRRLATITYESLSRISSLPVGTYVFSDLDRLTRAQKHLASEVRQFLAAQPANLLLLNDPSRFLGRFDLLRQLHDTGINAFNVYRPYEVDDNVRYPVFLRLERDHLGPRTPLIENREDLDSAITDAIMAGAWPDNLMIVEFCDTKYADGAYRKYSVWRFGKHFMARHLVIGPEWMLKVSTTAKGKSWPEEWVAEEKRFLETNPHVAKVREIFDIANLQYGRIDYGWKDGRIQVWEINTNPICMTPFNDEVPERLPLDDIVQKRFEEGWAAIDCSLPPGPPFSFSVDHSLLLKSPKTQWAWG